LEIKEVTSQNTFLQSMINTMVSCFFAVLLFSLLLPADSFAAGGGNTNGWKFQMSPYIWLPGQSGNMTLAGQPVEMDVDFRDDVLGNINMASYLIGEARKGSWGIVADIAYSDVEDDEAMAPGIVFQSINSKTETWMLSAAASYRAVEQENSILDIYAGLRYWSVDSTLTLQSAAIGNWDINDSDNWFDPIVGIKGYHTFGQSKVFISGGLSVGGFGAGSDFMWDVIATLGYQWTPAISTAIGYRYFDVDYDGDDFVYDMEQGGPMVGFTWRF